MTSESLLDTCEGSGWDPMWVCELVESILSLKDESGLVREVVIRDCVRLLAKRR